ncbi:glycerophosphodiester phosphodiesterase family protein [uncultured Pseudodesulfovibrio sp.]|uniref:glycerophosphodiester phosphodiesterase n=1 Tax=uncultured Pseudodesulfovibrio sp. TaxID=2035858 RepID=UPI0029C73DEB|nr:glycerophosphodiester phosphodiesterase family protein [uncultured Pseudodesulfovibrio sp.]
MFFEHLPGWGLVCAHRGARSLAPENTLLAAEQMVQRGTDFWEIDVHKIADGTLIVFHDDVLSRTTNVANHKELADRKPWNTCEFTYDELSYLDAGSWFLESDPYKTITTEVTEDVFGLIRAQRIPTLMNMLTFTRAHKLPMNIEIKDQIHSPGDLSIVGDVLSEIRKVGIEDLILISSFNHEYLREVRRLGSDLPLAVLTEDEHPENIPEYLRSLDAQYYHPDVDITPVHMIQELASEGIRVSPYTVNDMDKALELIDAGCFSVITDFPQRLRRLLPERV